MDKIPFSIYDFFGYLFAGFLLLVGTDYAFTLRWIIGRNMEAGDAAFWVVASYVIGHVNAHWASWLLENKAVRKLGYPSANLFGEKVTRPFKHYRAPLPVVTATRIRDKYARMIVGAGEGEDMFLYCYHLVKEQCPQAVARLNIFLGLYGFCRNISFASAAISLMLGAAAIIHKRPDFVLPIIACVVVSFTLFFRYLKFYRLYSVELFTSFLTGIKEESIKADESKM